MYYVYAIKSVHRNYIYVGISSNIARRLDQHNKGQNKSTKPYRPFFLFFMNYWIPEKRQERGKFILNIRQENDFCGNY